MEIGMKLICVKTHSKGYVKEGEMHVVKDLKLCVSCKMLAVDVGIKGVADIVHTRCNCGHREHQPNKTVWFSHALFRPLDDLYNTEIEELMNEVNEKQPFEL